MPFPISSSNNTTSLGHVQTRKEFTYDRLLFRAPGLCGSDSGSKNAAWLADTLALEGLIHAVR